MVITDKKIAGTPKVLYVAEKYLMDQTTGDDILWLGRGTSALILVYKTICKLRKDIKAPEIIIPAISCPSLTNAALMCGITPRYADVDCKTGLITLESIRKKYSTNTVAVLFVHLYGNTASLELIERWCSQKQVLLIEDNAQSLGAILPDGKSSGSVGDFSIYSFNKTKIIESGGGALILKRPEYTKELKEICSTSLPDETEDPVINFELAKSYRNLQHSLSLHLRLNPKTDMSKFMLSVRPIYDPLYFKTVFNAKFLAESFSKLDQTLNKRIEKANIYKKILRNSKNITLLNGWENSKCCWRFSFLFENSKKNLDLSQKIRNAGFHLSNCYWPANQFFKPDDRCIEAEYFGQRIMNVWVDGTVDNKWVANCAHTISKYLNTYNIKN